MIFGPSLSDKHRHQRQPGARWALLLFSCINLLNYADRYVLSAVKRPIKHELHLTDTQTALPATGMILVFMVCATIFGQLADKQVCDRRKVLCLAVFLWSLATALAGAAQSFSALLVFRSLIGVGEAAYTTIVPPLLCDFYPRRDRQMVFTVFYLCAPFGGALGFVVGAMVGRAATWRVAFLVAGVPGMLLAFFVPTVSDPHPGVNDDGVCADESERGPPSEQPTGVAKERRGESAIGVFFAEVLAVLRVPHWITSQVGLIAASFVVGGVTDWFGMLVLRSHPQSRIDQVAVILGLGSMVGGIAGTLLGAKLSQCLEGVVRNASLLLPAMTMVPCAALLFVLVNVKISLPGTALLLCLCWICFFCFTAPINVVILNSIPPHLRGRSTGLSIFLSHVLGDVISPPIIGAVSDGADLRTGMQLVWIASLISVLSWGVGSVLLPALDPAEPAGAEGQGGSLWSLLSAEGGAEGSGLAASGHKKGYSSTGAHSAAVA